MQLVDEEAKPSAGHAPLDPVQVSATSHWPAEPRHTVLLDRKTSTHVLLLPVQWSAPSQAPPCDDPVQLVADDANPFAGHVSLEPVQVSATSHWPADERHTLPAPRNPQVEVQHDVDEPFAPPRSHASAPKFVSTVPSPQLEL